MAITLRSNPKLDLLEQRLAEVFENKSSGAEMAIDAWFCMRKYTLFELKGKFTEEELYALVDAYNGTIFEPQYASSPQFIRIQIEDSIKFSGFSQDWKFKREEFLKKIDSLTAAQSYFLLEEIQRFWNKESDKKDSLHDFVFSLVK